MKAKNKADGWVIALIVIIPIIIFGGFLIWSTYTNFPPLKFLKEIHDYEYYTTENHNKFIATFTNGDTYKTTTPSFNITSSTFRIEYSFIPYPLHPDFPLPIDPFIVIWIYAVEQDNIHVYLSGLLQTNNGTILLDGEPGVYYIVCDSGVQSWTISVFQ